MPKSKNSVLNARSVSVYMNWETVGRFEEACFRAAKDEYARNVLNPGMPARTTRSQVAAQAIAIGVSVLLGEAVLTEVEGAKFRPRTSAGQPFPRQHGARVTEANALKELERQSRELARLEGFLTVRLQSLPAPESRTELATVKLNNLLKMVAAAKEREQHAREAYETIKGEGFEEVSS